MRVHQLLVEFRDEIVRDFVEQVRGQVDPPLVRGKGLLADHIPDFIEEIAAELRGLEEQPGGAPAKTIAKEHGRQRFAIGYELDSVVSDYGILRYSILRVAKNHAVTPDIDEFDSLAKHLNIGISEAVTSFVAERNAEVAAEKARLAYLSEISRLLASSLDYRALLGRLPALFAPRLAQWCVVYLETFSSVDEFPMVHALPERIPELRKLYQTIPLPETAALSYARVMRTGTSELFDGSSPGGSPPPTGLSPGTAPKSWLIVPLVSHGQTLGAAVLGELHGLGKDTPGTRQLAEEVAARAAAALDNARLYEIAQQQRSHAEGAIRAKDDFVAMISHELRTPLSAILGWTRMLRGGKLSEAKRARALEVIERNVNAQNQLVSDLLDISRIITGKVRINPTQLDLANVVEMTIEGIRPAAAAKELKLEVDLERGDNIIRADGDRVQQVVWNLLSNAVKFTPRHGRIEVILRRKESNLLLIVKDTGIGISPEFLPHVFEHFRQAEEGTVRNSAGLGLGLSIAKHLVEIHGGKITAASEGPGRGAEFRVELPIAALLSAAPAMQRMPLVVPEPVAATAVKGLKGLRVLIVEDQEDSRELLAEILSSFDLEVIHASGVAEALALLDRAEPDLLITDIGMPEQDGYALIRSIRSLPSSAHAFLPAIALTAYARNEDRMLALSEGFNEHLAKPVEPGRLLEAIVALVGRGPGAPLVKPPTSTGG